MQEANDIQNFYSEITRNQNTVYSINIYIEIYGKTLDALNDLEQQVKIELAGAGITYDQLHYEQRGGFQSAQPLGSDHFILCSNNLFQSASARDSGSAVSVQLFEHCPSPRDAHRAYRPGRPGVC